MRLKFQYIINKHIEFLKKEIEIHQKITFRTNFYL